MSSNTIVVLPSEEKETSTSHHEVATVKELTQVCASAVGGTIIEWYDFYIFGSLTTTIASKFYQTGTPDGDAINFLASYAIGFLVRPFGALFFGPLGDVLGRKATLMITMGLMGLCTVLVGVIPVASDETGYQMGTGAGYILIALRILQGLAIGGEYGGAATFISEYAPAGRRGFWTSFLQIAATAGLFMSLVVILIFRVGLGVARFNLWGWRLPFLVSILFLLPLMYIRLTLTESPLFAKIKKPFTPTGSNVWQRFASSFKHHSTPLYHSFCVPRNLKYVLLALVGATMGQGVVWYVGQFYALLFLQTYLKVPLNDSYIVVSVALLLGAPFFVLVGHLSDKWGRKPFMLAGLALAIVTWYPIYLSMYQFRFNGPQYSPYVLCFFVLIQVLYVTLVYGPIAAFLVELFPTSIRYTSMSFPYHIGNGVFGGLVPLIATIVIKSTGNVLDGLWFPLAVATTCFIVMFVFVPETYKNDIAADDVVNSAKA